MFQVSVKARWNPRRVPAAACACHASQAVEGTILPLSVDGLARSAFESATRNTASQGHLFRKAFFQPCGAKLTPPQLRGALQMRGSFAPRFCPLWGERGNAMTKTEMVYIALWGWWVSGISPGEPP